ncbi:hypothetical protein CRG98_035780 [Punica granatum]|uniref:Uncharacterized protein n=1 Tax=Punica granatum TaxID=22663 RepID=A0A2I0III4_PUNGR|nr:hypothetical protein CRG98_035780 [Punica granatum]
MASAQVLPSSLLASKNIWQLGKRREWQAGSGQTSVAAPSPVDCEADGFGASSFMLITILHPFIKHVNICKLKHNLEMMTVPDSEIETGFFGGVVLQQWRGFYHQFQFGSSICHFSKARSCWHFDSKKNYHLFYGIYLVYDDCGYDDDDEELDEDGDGEDDYDYIESLSLDNVAIKCCSHGIIPSILPDRNAFLTGLPGRPIHGQVNGTRKQTYTHPMTTRTMEQVSDCLSKFILVSRVDPDPEKMGVFYVKT